jgi:hypothetical protein
MNSTDVVAAVAEAIEKVQALIAMKKYADAYDVLVDVRKRIYHNGNTKPIRAMFTLPGGWDTLGYGAPGWKVGHEIIESRNDLVAAMRKIPRTGGNDTYRNEEEII